MSNHEQPPQSVENRMEVGPGEGEVFQKFMEILGGRKYDGIKKDVDPDGQLLSWEIRTDDTDDRVDIEYVCSKQFPGGLRLKPTIRQTLYSSVGVPCGAGAQY